ncbi:MAG: exosortase system-associated protein, TIGR04073 family [Myxococcota bacterium]
MRYAIVALALALMVPAEAEARSGRSYPVKIIWKLGRGLANIVRSPVEIPVNSYKEARGANLAGDNTGGQILGYFAGTITGVGFMIARIGSGVFDIATFPIPTKSLMQPPIPDGFIETLTNDKQIRNRPPRHHISPRAERRKALP